MDDAETLVLAQRYWIEPGGEDAWAEVMDHASERSADFPRLIVALVETVPPHDSIATIGTGAIETAHYAGATGAEIVEILLATGLNADTITRILAGVWPHVLDRIGMREHLKGVVSPSQIVWLLDSPELSYSGDTGAWDRDGIHYNHVTHVEVDEAARELKRGAQLAILPGWGGQELEWVDDIPTTSGPHRQRDIRRWLDPQVNDDHLLALLRSDDRSRALIVRFPI
jgi:hypothetical protein